MSHPDERVLMPVSLVEELLQLVRELLARTTGVASIQRRIDASVEGCIDALSRDVDDQPLQQVTLTPTQITILAELSGRHGVPLLLDCGVPDRYGVAVVNIYDTTKLQRGPIAELPAPRASSNVVDIHAIRR